MKLKTKHTKLRPGRPKVTLPPKVVRPFYLSIEWRSLIDTIKRVRGERCEDPDHQGGRGVGGRLFGDHIVELRDGGDPLNPRNIMLRCGSCHVRKTNRERGARYHQGGGREK